MTITHMELANLQGLIKFASPMPWRWATSNSMARLSSASGKDGDVIHAFKAADGVPCVNVSSDNMNLIASAVNYLPELLDHIDAQAALIAGLESKYREELGRNLIRELKSAAYDEALTSRERADRAAGAGTCGLFVSLCRVRNL
ncbi:hypothetical protein LU604_14780 [Erwinia tracheiphila]|uniref:Uncharacterized protein n=1 Tax=Erwinia tracheiphila TaxID=65700 RepID=A0A345CQ07_9GAMM|nr:hypothetical protein [Erwinia tracheiphila]AXF75524.1 hypothetical protein AV903_04435 [Erwinia tracheiphila]UIA81931.1 hypothetical protein LU604_14780 [Erwinia tracheiphila]UIA90527.1 hypothetical protein LU632_14355 [Erwinia tracheiphila]